MAEVRLIGLSRRYGAGGLALDDFSLDLEDGEMVTVVGPSGCGKSTLLRLIAGLEAPTAGEVHIDGRRVDGLAPQHRDVAMVFQSYALYPHMTVRGNIEFPLRMRGWRRSAGRARVEEVAASLELAELLDRRPAALSGGQRQRVALARALVRRPALFLLDEPLSNLDARLRTTVRRSIREIQERLGVTTLYVTHDQTEAMTLGRRVVVLDAGRIQMVAPPLDAWQRPANVFVAGFLGTPPMNLLSGRVADGCLHLGAQSLPLEGAWAAPLQRWTGPLTVGLRAESFVAGEGPAATGVRARIDRHGVEALGSEVLLRADLAGEAILVRLPAVGSERVVTVFAPTSEMHFFDAGGQRLQA